MITRFALQIGGQQLLELAGIFRHEGSSSLLPVLCTVWSTVQWGVLSAVQCDLCSVVHSTAVHCKKMRHGA